IDYVKAFTEEFSGLGQYFYEPVMRYFSGMKARLAFALSLAVEFDCYLIDEVIAVCDSRFIDKCQYELFEKRKDRSIILVLHSHSAVKRYCDNAVVLDAGKLYECDNMDEVYKYYHASVKS
ncbi:ATP-binding protein, partial [Neisseria iguanae]